MKLKDYFCMNTNYMNFKLINKKNHKVFSPCKFFKLLSLNFNFFIFYANMTYFIKYSFPLKISFSHNPKSNQPLDTLSTHNI